MGAPRQAPAARSWVLPAAAAGALPSAPAAAEFPPPSTPPARVAWSVRAPRSPLASWLPGGATANAAPRSARPPLATSCAAASGAPDPLIHRRAAHAAAPRQLGLTVATALPLLHQLLFLVPRIRRFPWHKTFSIENVFCLKKCSGCTWTIPFSMCPDRTKESDAFRRTLNCAAGRECCPRRRAWRECRFPRPIRRPMGARRGPVLSVRHGAEQKAADLKSEIRATGCPDVERNLHAPRRERAPQKGRTPHQKATNPPQTIDSRWVVRNWVCFVIFLSWAASADEKSHWKGPRPDGHGSVRFSPLVAIPDFVIPSGHSLLRLFYRRQL